jgi:hypothetical protein
MSDEKKNHQPLSPYLIHQKIRGTSQRPDEHDFVLWTDGSGYDIGYTGSASVLLENETGKKEIRISTSSYQSTHRAEFEALLNGLQSILDSKGWDSLAEKKRLDQSIIKPTVCWFGDCESLVLSVYIDDTTKEPMFRRRLNGDLWHRFSYYETAFNITPMYIERNSMVEHALTDRLAGEGRILLKEYMETLKADKVI